MFKMENMVPGWFSFFRCIFQSNCRFTAKENGRYRDFPFIPLLTCVHPPPLPTPAQNGTFVPRLTRHHSESILYTLGFILGGVHPICFDMCNCIFFLDFKMSCF